MRIKHPIFDEAGHATEIIGFDVDVTALEYLEVIGPSALKTRNWLAMLCCLLADMSDVAHRGVLDEGIHFIQKPFSKKDLAVKVRRALDN
jgi:hypothetical protein